MNRCALERHGVGLAAITPDPVDILRRFADANDIRYALLADVGGAVVDAFGIRNHNIRPNPRQAPGIPFPGHYLLDTDGCVLAKAFTGDLRHRASSTALVLEHIDVDGTDPSDGGTVVHVVDDELQVEITPSSDRLFGGQEIALRIRLTPRSGWHLYAADAPAPYTALTIRTDSALVAALDVRHPPAGAVELPAIGERLPVHAAPFDLTARLRLRWSPPPSILRGLDDAVAARAIPAGEHRIPLVIDFQTCSDDQCNPPRSVRAELPLTVEPHVPPPPS